MAVGFGQSGMKVEVADSRGRENGRRRWHGGSGQDIGDMSSVYSNNRNKRY